MLDYDHEYLWHHGYLGHKPQKLQQLAIVWELHPKNKQAPNISVNGCLCNIISSIGTDGFTDLGLPRWVYHIFFWSMFNMFQPFGEFELLSKGLVENRGVFFGGMNHGSTMSMLQ